MKAKDEGLNPHPTNPPPSPFRLHPFKPV